MPTPTETAFVVDRLRIVTLATEAALRPGIPPHWKAQMQALSGLASLDLHRVAGHADGYDGIAYSNDLLAISTPVDRLVEAIGRVAASEFSATIDLSLFTGQLAGALEGNACFEVEEAGRESDQDLDDSDEAPGSARAREAIGA